jgi:hypothetical protein
MKSAFAVTCLLLTLLLNRGARGQSNDEQMRKRFLAEYPQACKDWEDRCSNAVGSVNCVDDRTMKNGARHAEVVYSFECKWPDMARFETRQDEAGQSVGQTEVMNERYSFSLRKTADSKPYFLESVKQSGGPKKSPEGSHQRVPLSALRTILALPFRTIMLGTEMVSSPNFVVRAISPLVRDGKNLLKIEFDRPNPPNHVSPKNARDIGGFEGYFIVSPDERWVLYEFECAEKKGSPRALNKGSLEYGRVLEGFPIPRRVTQQRLKMPAREVLSSTTYDFVDFHFADAPDRNFTLTAFGIGEDAATPPSAPARSHSVGYWFLALAFAALTAAVLFKFASSRVKRRSAS